MHNGHRFSLATISCLWCLSSFLFLAGGAEAQDAPSYAQWPRESIFYHVYVRSFADSDGDGHGDLPGLTVKLDYIASLGVDAILLLPIFQNDHDIYGGYATTDFFDVEDDYGDAAAWDAFIDAARRRKIRVVLDLPATHVSETHPWFRAARADLAATEREHFIWAGPPCPPGRSVFGGPAWNPLGDGPCYYSSYGGTVPSLNIRNPATADAIISVATHWLGRGADGFRLDSAKHIAEIDPARPSSPDRSSPATHAFWRQFMAATKSAKPDSIAIAEVFDGQPSNITPFHTDGMDMAFDYPIFLGLVDAWTKGHKTHFAALTAASVGARPEGAMGAMFLGNHDVPGELVAPFGRTSDLLQGDPARLRSAAMLLFSLPSTPFIYYGEELGLGGGPSPNSADKKWSRNPMHWDTSPGRGFTSGTPWVPLSDHPANVADQEGDPASMLEAYRTLIRTRRESPALTHGSYRPVRTDHDSVFAFLRDHPQERVIVAVNFSGEPVDVILNLRALGIHRAKVSDQLTQAAMPPADAENAEAYPLKLAPYAGVWMLIQ